MRVLRVFLIVFACLIALLMTFLVLPGSRHENVRYMIAFSEHHKNPTEANRRELARVAAEDDRVLLIEELILALLFLGALAVAKKINRRLPTDRGS